MPYFVVPLAGRNPAAQIRLPNPGCCFGYLTNMAQHASGHEEHNHGTEQHDEQPEAEKTVAEVSQHTQFISFRESEIDVTPIIETYRRYSKGMIEAFHIQVVGNIGNELARANRC